MWDGDRCNLLNDKSEIGLAGAVMWRAEEEDAVGTGVKRMEEGDFWTRAARRVGYCLEQKVSKLANVSIQVPGRESCLRDVLPF